MFTCRCGRTASQGPAACACGGYLIEREAWARAPGDEWLGRRVLERYAILGALGGGGMAAVYRALDVRQMITPRHEHGDALACQAELPREPGEDAGVLGYGFGMLAHPFARGL